MVIDQNSTIKLSTPFHSTESPQSYFTISAITWGVMSGSNETVNFHQTAAIYCTAVVPKPFHFKDPGLTEIRPWTPTG